MTREELFATEEAVIDVPVAGALLAKLSRSASYTAAARGEIPTLRVGRRLVVPVLALRRMLDPAHDDGPASRPGRVLDHREDCPDDCAAD